jgi:hypothetical protein
MSNTLYGKAKEALESKQIDLTSDVLKACLVNASYTPNIATDQYLSTISANVVATSPQLTGITVTLGAFAASAVTISAVSGVACKYLVIYQATGNNATSRLIALIDTASGLPFTPTGSDVTLEWDTIIFAL